MACEHFKIDPLRAIEVIRRLPAGYLEQVMEYDAYRHAFHEYERTEKKVDLLAKGNKMIALVAELDAEIAQEELDER